MARLSTFDAAISIGNYRCSVAVQHITTRAISPFKSSEHIDEQDPYHDFDNSATDAVIIMLLQKAADELQSQAFSMSDHIAFSAIAHTGAPSRAIRDFYIQRLQEKEFDTSQFVVVPELEAGMAVYPNSKHTILASAGTGLTLAYRKLNETSIQFVNQGIPSVDDQGAGYTIGVDFLRELAAGDLNVPRDSELELLLLEHSRTFLHDGRFDVSNQGSLLEMVRILPSRRRRFISTLVIPMARWAMIQPNSEIAAFISSRTQNIANSIGDIAKSFDQSSGRQLQIGCAGGLFRNEFILNSFKSQVQDALRNWTITFDAGPHVVLTGLLHKAREQRQGV